MTSHDMTIISSESRISLVTWVHEFIENRLSLLRPSMTASCLLPQAEVGTLSGHVECLHKSVETLFGTMHYNSANFSQCQTRPLTWYIALSAVHLPNQSRIESCESHPFPIATPKNQPQQLQFQGIRCVS